MKVLLCAASVALAVTACTNDEQQGVDINRPIGLNPMPTPAASVQTKAAIDANPKAVAEFKAGNKAAVGPLVGAVMKMSKGKANPRLISQLLNKLLAQ